MLRLNLEGQASHLLPDISGTSMSTFPTSALLPVSQVLLCIEALTRTWLSSLVFLPTRMQAGAEHMRLWFPDPRLLSSSCECRRQVCMMP